MNQLGDLLFSLPVLKATKQKYPDIKLMVDNDVTLRKAKEIIIYDYFFFYLSKLSKSSQSDGSSS